MRAAQYPCRFRRWPLSYVLAFIAILVCASPFYAWIWYTWNGASLVKNATRLGATSIVQKIVKDRTGNALAVWDSTDGVVASTHAPSGGWGGGALVIPDTVSFDVAMNGGGDFVIAANRFDITTNPITYRIYAYSSLWGGNQLVSASADATSDPQVAISENGDLLVIWFTRGATLHTLHYRVFRSGAWSTDSSLDTLTTDGTPAPYVHAAALAADGSGNFTVAWNWDYAVEYTKIYGRRFAGGVWNPRELIAQRDGLTGEGAPQVTMFGNQQAIVVYEHSFTSYNGCQARMFSGGAWLSPVPIDAGSSSGTTCRTPFIASQEDGTAMAVFSQGTGNSLKVYANRYNGSAWEGAVEIGAGNAGRNYNVDMDGYGNAVAAFGMTPGMAMVAYQAGLGWIGPTYQGSQVFSQVTSDQLEKRVVLTNREILGVYSVQETYSPAAYVGMGTKDVTIAGGAIQTGNAVVDLTVALPYNDICGALTPYTYQQMSFSNNGTAWSAWEPAPYNPPYSTVRTGWDMTSATFGGNASSGLKRVYVRFRNANCVSNITHDEIEFTGGAKPTVSITATDASAAEQGLNPGVFTVTRTGSTTFALTVNYTVGGTATSSTDYQALSGTVTIPASSPTATITVTPIDDTTAESSETVIVTLSSNAAYTIGSPSSATVNIADNDSGGPLPIIDNAPVGQSGQGRSFTGTWCSSTSSGYYGTDSLYSCGSGTDTYRWTPLIPAPASYNVYVRWTAHTNRSTTVPISVTHAGGTTMKTFNEQTGGGVWVLHGTYNFNAGTAGYVQVSDANGQACADAVKFESAALPTVTIAATDAAAAEQGLDPGVFTVTRTGSTASPLTVYYTVAGTATPATDYQALPGTLTIPASSATATITVTPIDDTSAESSETVVVTLSTNAAYTVGTPSSATVNIADNDSTGGGPLPIIDNAPVGQSGQGRSFTGTWCSSTSSGYYGTDSLYSCGSGLDTYRWTPLIPAPASYNVYVRWTAHANRSTAVPIAVTHAGGTTTKTYNEQTGGGVWVLHGTYNFNAGTAGYVQVSDVNGQACADAVKFESAALPTVTIAATDAAAAEQNLDPGVFTVTRTGSTASPLTVSYTVGGTATPGSDYQALSGTVIIPASSATSKITVVPIDDTTVEYDETVVVTLSTDPAYTVGTPASATVTIESDDGRIIIDNAPVGQSGSGRSFTGAWCASSAAGYYGTNSLYGCGSGTDTYRWTPTIAAAGWYEVDIWWTNYSTRGTAVPVMVVHSEGNTTRTYNQQSGGGKWVLHGVYYFNAGTAGYVEVNDGTGFQACADAVRFSPSAPPAGPDLIISALTGPTAVNPPATVTYQVTTRNQGNGMAGASTSRLYLSADTVLDKSDYLIEEWAVTTLRGGLTMIKSVTLTLPSTTPPGTYYLIAVADATNTVSEVRETNNKRSLRVVVE